MKIYWKIAIWVVFLYVFGKLGLGEIFCIISGILLIFSNLGERKGASAYSIFNDGCQKLAGDIDPTAMLKKAGPVSKQENCVAPSYIIKNHRLANKPCPCGSGKKHKKCCLNSKDLEED